MERFIRPGLAIINPRLTDTKVNHYTRTRIISELLNNSDQFEPLTLYQMTQQIKIAALLSSDSEAFPFAEITFEQKLIPKLMKELIKCKDFDTKHNILCIFNSVAAMSSECCEELLHSGVVEQLISQFPNEDMETQKDYLWVLANVIADSDERRNAVVRSGLPHYIISLLKEPVMSYHQIVTYSWVLECLYKKGCPPWISLNERLIIIGFATGALKVLESNAECEPLLKVIGAIIESSDETMCKHEVPLLDFSKLLSLLDGKLVTTSMILLRIFSIFARENDNEIINLMIEKGLLNHLAELIRRQRKNCQKQKRKGSSGLRLTQQPELLNISKHSQIQASLKDVGNVQKVAQGKDDLQKKQHTLATIQSLEPERNNQQLYCKKRLCK
eukprot:TRINITY_DN1429_c0_g1_i2.p1 TRINITY_DN1429_c0_g1~~TRINITY_DN1429_c0_g1_i2.p1  ORF type:complete len:424 (+),score=8.00 TRINITY_DN1429_c0_g1_i2:112-1272(+)